MSSVTRCAIHTARAPRTHACAWDRRRARAGAIGLDSARARAHETYATHAGPSSGDMLSLPLWRRLLPGSLDPVRLLGGGHGRSSRGVADGQALDHDDVVFDEDGAELGEEGLEGEGGGGAVALTPSRL